jgi:Kef-type K+ transport system membrane component KefB
LLFEVMMDVNASDLKDVIRASMVLATIGVVAATVVGGVLKWKVGATIL